MYNILEMKKVKIFLIDLLKGIGVGFAAMIPGVSGGTIALLVNIYKKIISAISSMLERFWKSILILLPIIIGILIGAVGCIFGLKYAFSYILFSIVSLFFGFILGSIPSLYKETKSEKLKFKHILVFAITMIFVVGIALASFFLEMGSGYSVQQLFDNPKWYLYILLIPIGCIGSAAFVTPGVSGSMLMMVIGFYNPLFDTLDKTIHFEGNMLQNCLILGSFFVGIVLGLFLISKLMKFLLEKHKVMTYWGILGFITGSLPALYLNLDIWKGSEKYTGIFNHPWEFPLGICLLLGAAIGTYFILKYINNKKDNQNAENC